MIVHGAQINDLRIRILLDTYREPVHVQLGRDCWLWHLSLDHHGDSEECSSPFPFALQSQQTLQVFSCEVCQTLSNNFLKFKFSRRWQPKSQVSAEELMSWTCTGSRTVSCSHFHTYITRKHEMNCDGKLMLTHEELMALVTNKFNYLRTKGLWGLQSEHRTREDCCNGCRVWKDEGKLALAKSLTLLPTKSTQANTATNDIASPSQAPPFNWPSRLHSLQTWLSCQHAAQFHSTRSILNHPHSASAHKQHHPHPHHMPKSTSETLKWLIHGTFWINLSCPGGVILHRP